VSRGAPALGAAAACAAALAAAAATPGGVPSAKAQQRACGGAVGAEWPVPLPAWYWEWAQWQRNRSAGARPAAAPRAVPAWAWRRLEGQRGLPQLPLGGRDLLPRHRIVAAFGAPQDPGLGILGIGSVDEAARRLEAQSRGYRRPGRAVLPAFELIASIASRSAGADGLYRFRQPDRIICRYLRAAKRAGALLILDVQPGRADFVAEVRRLETYLRDPHVGLALDPEWKMASNEIPGEVIGHTDAATINRVSAYLAALVSRHRLPEKLLLVHQFEPSMIRQRDRLALRPGVALTINADGFGTQAAKVNKYRLLTGPGDRFFHGFKLFYEEDTGLMSPTRVLALRPAPDVVVYE
jgi:hypothetical protein